VSIASLNAPLQRQHATLVLVKCADKHVKPGKIYHRLRSLLALVLQSLKASFGWSHICDISIFSAVMPQSPAACLTWYGPKLTTLIDAAAIFIFETHHQYRHHSKFFFSR